MTGQVKFPSHNVTLKYSIFQIYDYNHISSPCCIISSPMLYYKFPMPYYKFPYAVL